MFSVDLGEANKSSLETRNAIFSDRNLVKGQLRLQKSEPGLRLRLPSRATAFAAPADGFGRTGESLKIAVHTVHLLDIKSQEHDESRPLRCHSSGRSACVDRRPAGAGKLCQRRRFNASDYIIWRNYITGRKLS